MTRREDEEIRLLLLEQWELLQKSLVSLEKSYQKCSVFYMKGQFTFEEEEAVNLKAVSKELHKVAEALEATDSTIAKYCKELGIDTPF